MAERKSVLLRIRPELWEELNRWAAEEFRSVNGQIEFLLQRATDEKLGKRGERGDDRPAKGKGRSR
jgi:hypothetical protein